jgi:hypothetical protein
VIVSAARATGALRLTFMKVIRSSNQSPGASRAMVYDVSEI